MNLFLLKYFCSQRTHLHKRRFEKIILSYFQIHISYILPGTLNHQGSSQLRIVDKDMAILQ